MGFIKRYKPNEKISRDDLLSELGERDFFPNVVDSTRTKGYFEITHDREPGFKALNYLRRNGEFVL